MIRLTKIVHFETAHAIHGYQGACKNIHGHSYELHVTVASQYSGDSYIPTPGFVIDFKEIKKMVNNTITELFDHKIVLSTAFLQQFPAIAEQENLLIWEVEPTAENLLIFIKDQLNLKMNAPIRLVQLKLFETKDSYAEWMAD
ncbi:MAG: 6-carboxytetrahydropterin synthase [Chitinophagaceae bacterium]